MGDPPAVQHICGLAKNRSPQCLSAIASGLTLRPKSLRDQFPELAEPVVERFRLFRSSQVAQNHEHVEEKTRCLIKEIITKRLPPLRRNFQKASGKPVMRNDLLHKALLEMLPDNSFSANAITEDCINEL